MKVGIVGTSGYAGAELLRLLLQHPQASIEYIASTSKVGTRVDEVLPSLSGLIDRKLEPVDPTAMANRCDVVFTATPHGVSMDLARELIRSETVLIDIASDFRFADHTVYEAWYQKPHKAPELTKEAAYGLVELFKDRVKEANLIANPGCYPTSALIALAPLAAAEVIDLSSIVICSMSGVSGAGATPGPMYHFPEAVENVQAYGMPGHRHTPEIEHGLARLINDDVPPLTFSPHLVPMSRGIMTHVNAKASAEVDEGKLINIFEEFYHRAPFVRVLKDRLPKTKLVAGTNFCDVAPRYDARTGRVMVASAIDNLIKGASGQAVQNMNVRFGLDERTGLWNSGFHP